MIEDLINFRPTPGVGRMEPLGWAIVGLPTNFWVDASGDVQQGVLLGQMAQVRFTPLSYRWDYGDGMVANVSSRGGSWDQLRVAEFDTTAASHVYERAGTYGIALRVNFGAEFRFDTGDWIPIVGVVPSDSASLEAIAGTATTILVAENCLVDPDGPGC